jgi:plastocyanin
MTIMRINMSKRVLGAGSAAVLAVSLVMAVPASAAPATSVTTHFSTLVGWNTAINPVNPGTCPTWAVNDNVLFDMTGNGVQHVTYNAAGDSWFTTTFSGTGTIAFYNPTPSNYIYDGFGNITGLSNTAPAADAVVTGHLTQWFGFQSNLKNAVGAGTVELRGTYGTGTPITLHFRAFARWAVGSDPFGPPTVSISLTSC